MEKELQLLIDALEKKAILLENILEQSNLQFELVQSSDFDADAFDVCVDEKAGLLSQLELIDQGFDGVFSKIKDELVKDQSLYRCEIAQLQDLIRQTMDIGSSIFTTEQRTKSLLSSAVTESRKELRRKKMTANSVADYYKANGIQFPESYFYDTKQ